MSNPLRLLRSEQSTLTPRYTDPQGNVWEWDGKVNDDLWFMRLIDGGRFTGLLSWIHRSEVEGWERVV